MPAEIKEVQETKRAPRLLGDSNRLRVPGVNALGPLEKMIMDYAWVNGTISVSQVHRAFRNGGKDLAYTTIMTTMTRLASKGLLKVDKSGVTYMYAPAKSKDEYTDAMVSTVMDALVDISPEAVFAHLAKRFSNVEPAASTG